MGNNLAAITNPIVDSSKNYTGIQFFQKALPSFISLGIVIGAVIFFFNLMVGAIQWISSGGDKQALESARGKISNALIGLLILFSIFAVATLIGKFFKVEILTLDIGKLIIR